MQGDQKFHTNNISARRAQSLIKCNRNANGGCNKDTHGTRQQRMNSTLVLQIRTDRPDHGGSNVMCIWTKTTEWTLIPEHHNSLGSAGNHTSPREHIYRAQEVHKIACEALATKDPANAPHTHRSTPPFTGVTPNGLYPSCTCTTESCSVPACQTPL